MGVQSIWDHCSVDLWWVQPRKDQPYLCCRDGSGTVVSRETPGEALRIPHGRQVPITHVCSHSPSGETMTRAIPLPPLGRQQYRSTTEHISLSALTCSFISSRSALDICWCLWWDQCTSQSLLFPCSISPLSTPPAPHRACPNHKSTREDQFCSRPSQKPLTGPCRACGSISKFVRRFTLQLYHE